MEYKKDERGKEVLLKEGKFQVMMEWEKPYMQACIDALKPFGDVLEIGFGLGYSAEHIQKYHPKSHTIVECDPQVAERARVWAKNYPNVKIVENTWQEALPKLGVFDCIFFDDYPLQSEQEMQQMKQESGESALLLKQGQQLIHEVEKAMPFLNEIQYSDADLEGLVASISTQRTDEVKQLGRFLRELAGRGQITQQQLKKLLERLGLPHEEAGVKKTPFSFAGVNDRLFTFLSACLEKHMRKGSRFSCFLEDATSRFEDKKFFNEIIVNPFLEFREKQISVEVPENCTYFKGNKALVITIEKMI